MATLRPYLTLSSPFALWSWTHVLAGNSYSHSPPENIQEDKNPARVIVSLKKRLVLAERAAGYSYDLARRIFPLILEADHAIITSRARIPSMTTGGTAAGRDP